MLQILQVPVSKRYKIFRAVDSYYSVPQNYTEIDDILIDKDITPTYTDLTTYGNCFPAQVELYRIRYKIKAVDNTNWASVYSDFVSTSTADLKKGGAMVP